MSTGKSKPDFLSTFNMPAMVQVKDKNVARMFHFCFFGLLSYAFGSIVVNRSFLKSHPPHLEIDYYYDELVPIPDDVSTLPYCRGEGSGKDYTYDEYWYYINNTCYTNPPQFALQTNLGSMSTFFQFHDATKTYWADGTLINWQNRFVPDMENLGIVIEAAFLVPSLDLKLNLPIQVLNSDGSVFKTVEKGESIRLTIAELLQLGGISSIDDTFPEGQVGGDESLPNPSYRITGNKMRVMFKVDNFESFGTDISVTMSASRGINWGYIPAIYTSTEDGRKYQTREANGLQVQTGITGAVGEFDWPTLFQSLVQSFVVLGSAKVLVELYLGSLYPHKYELREYILQPVSLGKEKKKQEPVEEEERLEKVEGGDEERTSGSAAGNVLFDNNGTRTAGDDKFVDISPGMDPEASAVGTKPSTQSKKKGKTAKKKVHQPSKKKVHQPRKKKGPVELVELLPQVLSGLTDSPSSLEGGNFATRANKTMLQPQPQPQQQQQQRRDSALQMYLADIAL